MTLAIRRRFARHVLSSGKLRAEEAGWFLTAHELVHVLLLWIALVGVLVLVGYAFYAVRLWTG